MHQIGTLAASYNLHATTMRRSPRSLRDAVEGLFCSAVIADVAPQSAVVKPQWMEAGQRPLSPCPSPCQRIVGEVVDQMGGPDSLGKIPTPVMALDEHPARVLGAGRHSPVPNVGHKKGDVTRFGHNGDGTLAFPLEIIVGKSFYRWCLSRCVTSGDKPGWSSRDRAVPEVEVGRNGEYRIGNSGIPGNTGLAGYVRTAIDVPKAPEVVVIACWLPPGGVGDDVAIFAQKGLDDLEDSRVADGVLDETTPVEHLVAKWRRLLGRVSSFIGWEFLKNPFDICAKRDDLIFGEYVMDDDVAVGLEARHRIWNRTRSQSQVSGGPSEHYPILPSTCRGDNRLVKSAGRPSARRPGRRQGRGPGGRAI